MKCYGIFKFAEDPYLINAGNTVKSVFELYYTIKKPDNNIEKTYLPFECWDSAAEYICNNCKAGDSIYVEASPKTTNEIIFRINSFKVFHV
jgi:hypothetical protein